MNGTTKSGLPPIAVPLPKTSSSPAKPATPSAPAKPTPVERLERALIGKYFYFVYNGGTRFRAGKFEEVLTEVHILVRYFNLRSGKLERWRHAWRMYDNPRAESLTGTWIFDSEEDLKTSHVQLLEHVKNQEEVAAKEGANAD
jgi:hypothetical protein